MKSVSLSILLLSLFTRSPSSSSSSSSTLTSSLGRSEEWTTSLPWPCLFASASDATRRFMLARAHGSRSGDGSNNYSNKFDYNSDRQIADTSTQRELENDDAAAQDAKYAQDLAADGQDDNYLADLDFDGVSIMPVSCVNYHNGHMIKFQFFEKSSSLNCHFKNLGTFVVSIAHYMRAYFNQQALIHGNNFHLPGDVGFLNCVLLKETANSELPLYAKIGCQHRDTYTSTKLQLIVYKDAQCSKVFSNAEDKNNGYDLNGYFLSNKVSFRPPFYSCQSCLPEEISDQFTKRYSAWYDDDYISRQGKKQSYNDDGAGGQKYNVNSTATNSTDDGGYYQSNDDIYGGNKYNNDDNTDDGNQSNHYVNTDDGVYYNYRSHDDDFYAIDDDNRRLRQLVEVDASHSITAKETLVEYAADFQEEMGLIHRQLQDANNGGDVSTWNMCDRVHHYGMWCNEDCRSLDTFRVDEWSRSDIFLLVIMSVFMGAMMLLVFAKRVKAYERAAMWGDEPGAPNPGLPPMAMLMLFATVFTLIVVLATLKFVNETLVFAVVMCILLFIYMLKLTLFESRKPQFLPARGTRSTKNQSLKEPFYTGAMI
eukprot:g8409.t1 g8409   contig3:21366-23731(-)